MSTLNLPAGGIPVLETARLRLRAHRDADFEDLAAMWASEAVNRHIGAGSSRPECWTRLLSYGGHWLQQGFGYWAVEEKAGGRFVGDVGLADFKRDLQPSIEGMAECGWVLAPWSHGRGYGTEAVRAVLAWASEHLPGKEVVCLIATENAASLRLAAKCGFVVSARTVFKGSPTILFRLVSQ